MRHHLSDYLSELILGWNLPTICVVEVTREGINLTWRRAGLLELDHQVNEASQRVNLRFRSVILVARLWRQEHLYCFLVVNFSQLYCIVFLEIIDNFDVEVVNYQHIERVDADCLEILIQLELI